VGTAVRGLHFSASHLQRREYLHERDVTVAVLSEGTYGESKPYADFLGYTVPWYSARASTALTAGRDFGYIACYLRNHDHAYETYWSTDRGTEAMGTSYHLLDLTVFGRQEGWEDSPQGWPRLSADPPCNGQSPTSRSHKERRAPPSPTGSWVQQVRSSVQVRTSAYP